MQTMFELEARAFATERWPLKEILVPSDLSDASRAAAVQAAVLGARFGSRLTLYHALEFPDHESPHWAFSDRTGVLSEHERSAHLQLEECARAMGVAARTVVERAASASLALAHRIQSSPPDLVLMGSHHRAGLSHLLCGSVSEELATQAGVPVLSLQDGAALDHALAGCTVLATDFTPEAAPALYAAGTLSKAFGGNLLVVYCPTTKPDHPWTPYSFAERWLSRLSRNLSVRVVVDTAPVSQAVGRLIVREKAGLLVLSRRNGPTAGETSALVRHAPSSVLVV